MLHKATLLAIIMCYSCQAAITESPTKPSREQLVLDIYQLEETIKGVEPKIEWFQKDMEDKVWRGPFSEEAEKSASFYGNLVIGLSNARARLARMKRDLIEYGTE